MTPRNIGIFLTAVAVSAAGIVVGRALTDDDVAAAAARDFAITRKGSTARVEVVCITRGTAQDGGVAYDLAPQGKHTETMPADDGGTESTIVSSSQAVCQLSGAPAASAAALFDGAALVCYRRGARLER